MLGNEGQAVSIPNLLDEDELILTELAVAAGENRTIFLNSKEILLFRNELLENGESLLVEIVRDGRRIHQAVETILFVGDCELFE